MVVTPTDACAPGRLVPVKPGFGFEGPQVRETSGGLLSVAGGGGYCSRCAARLSNEEARPAA
jgi:hypothetical protein